MKTTVIFHSADWDGRFCEAIARKFLPADTQFIGWDFSDPPLPIQNEGTIYVMDLPVDRVFGKKFEGDKFSDREIEFISDRIIWIDHHKSSIESHPHTIPGYRIDGVAACRLVWQWFTHDIANKVMSDPAYLPTKEQYMHREVIEPMAVRLAGEYDIWDHRGDGDIEFQFGLDSEQNLDWNELLKPNSPSYAEHLVICGRSAMACYAKRDADIMRSRSFHTWFEGLHLLCLNTARCNSNTFTALDVPETGHDALCGFYFNGKKYVVSLYHAAHRKDLDLSKIAVKYGGGGHRGACGFQTETFPFPTAS